MKKGEDGWEEEGKVGEMEKRDDNRCDEETKTVLNKQ